jgi:uncharacterized heparinase superfamily protein
VNTAGLGRLGRTVIQLRSAQGGQRARLRAQRMLLDHSVPFAARWLLAGPDPASGQGWPAAFTPLDAGLWSDRQFRKALRAGEISLLGVPRAIAGAGPAGEVNWAAADWAVARAPLLWRFHLYYWDWAWALAAPEPLPRAPLADERELFAEIWRSWHAAVIPGRGPAWHPYPAALRAWSFCGIYSSLVAGGPVDGQFRAELAAHAGFLRRSLETDVGGNHLIKNLKALAGLAVFFGDHALLAWSMRRLGRQLAVQVLPDGGHYERAPAYHCQVLADLIDTDGLLRAAGLGQPAWLAEAVSAMRGWLGCVVTPAGPLIPPASTVPLLNDGFPVSAELLARLAPAAPPAGPLHVLPDTGLARISAGWWRVLADVGPPCPRELPAHAHADTLSCVVHVDGAPLLIDTGTSSYAAGPVRDRERSTAAHNTVEVDGRDSTEVWGAFRAGRRARVTGLSASVQGQAVTVEAAHDGYRGLPGRPGHRRRWTVRAAEMRVDDELTGTGRHRVTVRWHLAPGTGLRLVPGGAVASTAAGEISITVTATSELTVLAGTAQVSAGFGRTEPAPVLACTLHPELPARVSTVWRRAEPPQEPT